MQAVYLDIAVVIKQSHKSGEWRERKHHKANKTKLTQESKNSRKRKRV